MCIKKEYAGRKRESECRICARSIFPNLGTKTLTEREREREREREKEREREREKDASRQLTDKEGD